MNAVDVLGGNHYIVGVAIDGWDLSSTSLLYSLRMLMAHDQNIGKTRRDGWKQDYSEDWQDELTVYMERNEKCDGYVCHQRSRPARRHNCAGAKWN